MSNKAASRISLTRLSVLNVAKVSSKDQGFSEYLPLCKVLHLVFLLLFLLSDTCGSRVTQNRFQSPRYF